MLWIKYIPAARPQVRDVLQILRRELGRFRSGINDQMAGEQAVRVRRNGQSSVLTQMKLPHQLGIERRPPSAADLGFILLAGRL